MSHSFPLEGAEDCGLNVLLDWELLPSTLSLGDIKKLVVLEHITHKGYSWSRPKHLIQETCNIVHSLLKLSEYAPFSEALRAEVREVHDSVLNALERYPLVLRIWEATGSPVTALRSFVHSSQSAGLLSTILDAEGEIVAGRFFFCYYARLIYAPEEDVVARAFALVVQFQRIHAPSSKPEDALLLTLSFKTMRMFSALRYTSTENTAPDAVLSHPLHVAFPDINALCKVAPAAEVSPLSHVVNEGSDPSSSVPNHLLNALLNVVSEYCQRQGQLWIFSEKAVFLQLVEKLVGTLEWSACEEVPEDYLPPRLIQELRKEMLKQLIWKQRKALLSRYGMPNVTELLSCGKYSQVRLLVQAFDWDSTEYASVSECCIQMLRQKRDKQFSGAQSLLNDELSGKAAQPQADGPITEVHGVDSSGRGNHTCVNADSPEVQMVSMDGLKPRKRKRGAERVSNETGMTGVGITTGTAQAGPGAVTTVPDNSLVEAGLGDVGGAGVSKKRWRRRLKQRLSCKCFNSGLPLVYLDYLTETCCTAMLVAREVLGSEQYGLDKNLKGFFKETWEQMMCDREGSQLLCLALDCLLRDDACHRSRLTAWVNREPKWLQNKFYKELPVEFARHRLKHMTGTGRVEGSCAVARCCLGRNGKLLSGTEPAEGPVRNESRGTEDVVQGVPWSPIPGPLPPSAWHGRKRREVAVGNVRDEFCLLESRFWEKWETSSKVEEIMTTLEAIGEAVASQDAVQHMYRDMFFKRLSDFDHVVPSSPLEARMLEALLPLVGAQTVTDMEGAMEDLRSVNHNDNLYHLSRARQPTLVSDDCRLSVTTHCEGLWPPPPGPSLKSLHLPAPMARCVEKYKAFYSDETKNRHLRWQHTLGRCQLSMTLPQGQHLMVVATTLQAAVLLHFETPQAALSFDEIRGRLNIAPHHLRPLLHSLACCKRPLLKKSPKEHGPVGCSDVFQVHSGNRPYLRRRKLEMPPPVMPEEYERQWPGPLVSREEGADGPFQGVSEKKVGGGAGRSRWGGVVEGQSMKYAVDAGIVAVLKKKRRLLVDALVQEVVGKLSEWGDVSVEYVTTRIDALEGRDFLKREEGDPPAITYLP